MRYLYILISLFVLSSCEKFDDGSNINSVNDPKSSTVVDGRFFFSSKEELKKTMEKFKKEDLTTLENKFEKLYSNGFRSKYPIVNPNNKELVSKFEDEYASTIIYEKKAASKIIGNNEGEDNSIGDPYFAAVVNNNNEIIIGDSLYKIIKDLGVLSVKVKDSTFLYDYLNKLNEKASKTSKSNFIPIDACLMQSEYGGYTEISPQISRYIAPAEGNCNSYDPPTPVIYIPQISPEEQLQNQINSLTVCDGERDTSFFQSLFGTNKSCINYFDSRHRIKTEFWNQSWGIYSSIGVEVRTQVKTLLIWWASDSDDLYMGINRILLRYNYKAPQIESNNPFASNPLGPIYMYNNNYQVIGNDGFFHLENLSTGPGLPFFTFNSDNILNVYIRQLPNPNYQLNNESNIKQLYQLGINFLQKQYNSTLNKDFVVTYQKNTNEIEVVYFGEKYKQTNTNQIFRKFDDQYLDFLIGYSSNLNSSTPSSNNPQGINASSSFSLKVEKGASYRNYTYYELDFYGLGRMGSTWSGNRVIKVK